MYRNTHKYSTFLLFKLPCFVLLLKEKCLWAGFEQASVVLLLA